MAIRERGREAVTHWRVLERYAGGAELPRGNRAPHTGRGGKPAEPVAGLLDCRLETGRTHQIRVHLASIGHPVMGDPTYGAGFRTKRALLSTNAQAALADLGRQALHAYLLSIKHPSSGEILRFRSELPPDLTRLHDELVRGRAESSQMSPDRG
jgi:23S rRNA pseudouridine1911/1915/1917 synthase